MKRIFGIGALAIAACAACCAGPILAALALLGGAASLGGIALGWWGAGLTLVVGGVAFWFIRRRRMLQARCGCPDTKCAGPA